MVMRSNQEEQDMKKWPLVFWILIPSQLLGSDNPMDSSGFDMSYHFTHLAIALFIVVISICIEDWR